MGKKGEIGLAQVCIPWETLEKCIELSLDNSQRLVNDAEYLLKGGRLSSAKVLTVFSLEEIGKALLACDYLEERKDVPVKDYKEKFMDHLAKINRTLDIIEEIYPKQSRIRNAIWGSFAKELRTQTLDAIFVKYDGQSRMWFVPWSEDSSSLLKTYDIFTNLKNAKDIRGAQKVINKIFIENLMKETKIVLQCARERKRDLKQIGIVT